MDIEGLIENLKTLSDILKSKPIRESTSLSDFEKSFGRFEAALSDLKGVSKRPAPQDSIKLKSVLENLGEIIAELSELCDDRLSLLEFVSEITPIKSIEG